MLCDPYTLYSLHCISYCIAIICIRNAFAMRSHVLYVHLLQRHIDISIYQRFTKQGFAPP